MAQEPKHPLLSLPDDEIIKHIRGMDLLAIIKFSLLSERSKNLVKSIKIQGTGVTVDIISEVEVCFELKGCELTFRDIKSSSSELQVKKSSDWHSIVTETTITKDGFGMVDWMKHLYTIFNYPVTDSITFISLEYDPVDIKKCFGVPSRLTVGGSGNLAQDQLALQTLLPIDALEIDSDMFQNSKIPREVLMQNFNTLTIREGDVTLDDLLTINSKSMVISNAKMGPKDINEFIKLWQHGANPRMEHLRLYYKKEKRDDEETILKGINYREDPNNKGRWFRHPERKYKKQWVSGIVIVRKDGVRATIRVGHARNDSYEMFV